MPFNTRNPFLPKAQTDSNDLTIADVTRLMDPSYCFPQCPSSEPTKVHIDSEGQMHDPDFRSFPVFSAGQIKRGSNPFAGVRVQSDEEIFQENDEEEELQPQRRHRRESTLLSQSQLNSNLPSIDSSHYYCNPSASSSSSSLSSDTSSLSSYTKKILSHNPMPKIRSFDFMDWYYQYDPDYRYEDPVVEIQMNEEYIPEPDLAENSWVQATPLSYCQRIKERWTKSRLGDAFKRKSSRLSIVTYP